MPDQDADRAFEDTFHAYWSRVCATLYRLVGDWDEAEDLALEVFCRLRERPPEDGSRLNGWLHRVATHMGLNALRTRERRRRYEELAQAFKLQQATPVDSGAEAERADEHQRARQVLAQMKPRAAELLILRHSGLPYADIAAILHVAPSSIGTLLARAEKDFERRYRALERSDGSS